MTPFTQELRLITGKQDHIQLKICTANERINQVKIKTTGRERLFASYTSHSRLISRIHKELKVNNQPRKQWVRQKLARNLLERIKKKEIRMTSIY